jgi:hypothetical protein
MAWENFWALENGKRVTSRKQLNAFRTHFPDRVVESRPHPYRPLMMVLEKPYKLTSIRTAEAYELEPVHLREIQGWPPSLSLSRFGHFPRPGEGDLVDAKIVPPVKAGEVPLLLIRGEFEQQEGGCTIVGYPAVLLDCIARTLNAHQGEPFRSLSHLELHGID